jgi:hypothetical protein
MKQGGIMQGTREQFDADRSEEVTPFAELPNGHRSYELNCGICNKLMFVDKPTYEHAVRSIEEGLDNPFVCDDCELADDDNHR